MRFQLQKEKLTIPVRLWNFANTGGGVLTYWAVCFGSAVGSVIYLKYKFTAQRKDVVRQKILEHRDELLAKKK